jgi:hypothetical protein
MFLLCAPPFHFSESAIECICTEELENILDILPFTKTVTFSCLLF